MYKVSQTYGFRERYLSFLTCTTRLTPQENVFLKISINVYGDTLHEYVFACVNYRTLPLRSTHRVGFRDNNMLSSCFYIYRSNFCTNDFVTLCFDKQTLIWLVLFLFNLGIFDKTLSEVIRVVNFIKASALNNRLFDQLCTDMGAEHTHLLFHTEVRWLSKGRVLTRFYELRHEIHAFLIQKKVRSCRITHWWLASQLVLSGWYLFIPQRTEFKITGTARQCFP